MLKSAVLEACDGFLLVLKLLSYHTIMVIVEGGRFSRAFWFAVFVMAMAILLWKEVPVLKICSWCIVQIIVIYLAMRAKQAHFCDCCRNMGHFLCGLAV